MPNKNYSRGRRKEYTICEKLRKEGFTIVQRTAGSHSPFDIIAIDQKLHVIRFVQCKPENFSETEKSKLWEACRWLNNPFRCEFEVV